MASILQQLGCSQAGDARTHDDDLLGSAVVGGWQPVAPVVQELPPDVVAVAASPVLNRNQTRLVT